MELQELVSYIFRDSGYETCIEKEINTAGGKTKVDIYAEEIRSPLKPFIICECKLWDKPVPKSVVHSFRSIVSDCGANYGYLISKRGFQSGAYEAAKHSNIVLLSWHEFQIKYVESWNRSAIKKINMVLSEITNASELLSEVKLPNKLKSDYSDNLKNGLSYAINFSCYTIDNINIDFPVKIRHMLSGKPMILRYRSDLLEYAIETAESIIAKFRDINLAYQDL